MLIPDDLIDPRGSILPDWFGGYEDTHERVEIYLAEAYDKPEIENADDQDAAARRWVEYRALDALQRRLAGTSGLKSMTLNDQGSFTMDEGAQSRSFAHQANNALMAWRLLTAEPPTARSADGRYSWPAWEAPSDS